MQPKPAAPLRSGSGSLALWRWGLKPGPAHARPALYRQLHPAQPRVLNDTLFYQLIFLMVT